MKVVVILMVAMVMMMMCQKTESWNAWSDRNLGSLPTVKNVKSLIRSRVGQAVGGVFRRWGKREVRDAEFDAAFNAAIEDGILTDDEIQSVLGVSAEELDGFKEDLDMDGNGEISVAEYFVAMAATSAAEEEGQDDGQQ